MDYSSDRALKDRAGDEFSHLHYADALADILLKSETPLNVGLCGKWGVGKSSIAHMLRDRIRSDESLKDFGYAEVDAWGLAPESLPQGLLEELNSQLGSPYKQKELDDMLYNQRQVRHADLRRPGGRRRWIIVGAGAAAATVAALSQYPDAAGVTVLGVLGSALLALSIRLIFGTTGRTVPPAASPRQFGRIYDEIRKRGSKKTVVVIDNLDRCESAVAVKLLGLIQTFMVKDGCVNVLACDDEALVSHLKSSGMARTDRDGGEFLSKFFQVTLRVPSFMPESLRSYAKKQIAKRSVDFDQFALTVLLSGAVDNPRKINQFLNIAVALYRLAESREKSGMVQSGLVTGDTNSLLKSVVLRHEWPRFCEAVEADPGMYQDAARQREWCERAVAGETMPEAERSRLLRFLDATQMPGADIVPFLRMSQPPHAAQPGMAEFEDAFSRSDPEAARTFGKLDAGAQEAYLSRIDEILRESASESDPSMPALSGNVAMLAELVKAAPGSPVRARMAATLGQYVAGPLLGNARGMVERIGAEQVGLMPARMRDGICESLVLEAFQADPPDITALELFSKNRAIIGDSLAERMGKMAVEKIDAAGLWDGFFVAECLEYRREGARMAGLVSKIISEATFGVDPASGGYDMLCAQLAESLSADEAGALRSRIAGLVRRCADANAPLPERLLEQIGRIDLDEKIDGALHKVLQSSSDQRQNTEILRIMAKKRGEDAKYLETASDAFAEFKQEGSLHELLGILDDPQYRQFLTTKAAIDSMLELLRDGDMNPRLTWFLLTRTPDGLKEHVGSAFFDAIASKGAFRYGLRLDEADVRSEDLDSGLIATIADAYVTKARNLKRRDQYDAYMLAAEMGNQKHADEIASYAESLTESADENKRNAGFRLLEALKKNKAGLSEAGQ